jgi:hypothetical protein
MSDSSRPARRRAAPAPVKPSSKPRTRARNILDPKVDDEPSDWAPWEDSAGMSDGQLFAPGDGPLRDEDDAGPTCDPFGNGGNNRDL